MDEYLVNYLKSGNAWLLVGSGPSIDMGYPSSYKLAVSTLGLAKSSLLQRQCKPIEDALSRGDYPLVFEQASSLLGPAPVLAQLRNTLKPTQSARIYKLLVRWPVPVYLTTNYDDEIQTQLTVLGETYIPYSNSQDHLDLLTSDLSGAIFKIHGDLRSETGLILTTSQYRAIQEDDAWKYWRTKLTSIFQLVPVIIIGHSLSDPNIRHILEAAKQGAGIHQPVCWIAPDIQPPQIREYLEKYRIRVVSYDNRDGSHANLYRLIDNVNQFVYPRAAIQIRKEIAQVSSSLGQDAAAPGFFVFTRLLQLSNFDLARVETILAIIQSVIPKLKSRASFTIEDALRLAGWPADTELSLHFKKQIIASAVDIGLLATTSTGLSLGPKADPITHDATAQFSHLRDRFITSLVLRIRRNYSQFSQIQAEELAKDIEASLVGFFRESGLCLATILFSSTQGHTTSPVPHSVIPFVNESAARYDDLLHRQAYSTVAIEIFTQPEDSDKEYLGRISQGFFAFHALGLFGEAANERLRNARLTAWLIDSSAQIPALALAAPTCAVFRDAFLKLTGMGIRLFTTDGLFDETREHYWFADKVIRENGAASQYVIAAALGQSPYRKANQFLEGFIRWQAAGNPPDWDQYSIQTFGDAHPSPDILRKALYKIGIEVVSLNNWPGYNPEDSKECKSLAATIVQTWEKILQSNHTNTPEVTADYYEKAEPEAEALLIVLNERKGKYHAISEKGKESPAWFVSRTSMLNLTQPGPRITWQPEAFLRFASTLAPSKDPNSAARAFDVLLFAFSEAGVSLLDQKSLQTVFKGVIDQATLSLEPLTKSYEETLEWKYSESPENILKRISPPFRPLAALQLANEIANVQSDKSKYAEAIANAALQRASRAEKKLERLEGVQQQIIAKRRERERQARKRKARKIRK